jgi:RNase P subunit RPR2
VTRQTVTCPKCGTVMNHQAEKLVQAVTAEEAASAESSNLDGMLVLVYACPGCGWIESRRDDGA